MERKKKKKKERVLNGTEREMEKRDME